MKMTKEEIYQKHFVKLIAQAILDAQKMREDSYHSALFYKGKIEENKWKPQMSFDLVHIDCDLITPTRAAIKKFIDISKVIIFDDYNTIFPQITEEVNRKFIFKNIFTFAHGQAVVML